MKEQDDKLDELDEQAKRLFRVSIKTPEHLKAWLRESGRDWVVFNSADLVDSLPFPEGLDTFLQLVACYRDHRMTKPSNRTDNDKETPLMKTDMLEVEEMDRLVRHLIGEITERNPDWDINQPL